MKSKMTPEEYRKLAARTLNSHLDRERRQTMIRMGLLGEVGELSDYLKKCMFHGHPFDHVHVVKEVGDSSWYVAAHYSDSNRVLPCYWTPPACDALKAARLLRDGSNIGHQLVQRTTEDALRKYVEAWHRGDDMLWGPIVWLSWVLGVDLQEAARLNIEKLQKRYPEGFSETASMARLDMETT